MYGQIPQFVYGDSYGGVQQNQLALDAARDSRYFQSLADQRSRERQISDANLAQQGLDQSRNQAQAQMAQAFQENQQRVGLQRDQMAQQGSQFDRGLANQLLLEQMRVSPYADKMTLKDQFQVRNQAINDINNGVIKSPSQLDAYVGGVLPPADMVRLHQELGEQHNRLLNAFGQQQSLANNLTTQWQQQVGPMQVAADAAQAQRTKAINSAYPAAQLHAWDPIDWFRTSKETLQGQPPPAPLRMFNQADEDFQKNLMKDKRAQSQVGQDITTHRFMPVMPQPETWDGGGGSTNAVPLLSSAPSTQAAPLAPSAPAVPPTPTAPSLDSWIAIPGKNLLIHPSAWTNIQAKLATIPDEATRGAAAQTLLQQALASGAATNTSSQ